MSNVQDMLVLLGLGAAIGVWLKLSTARERAVRIARAQCLQHGLQLLDETVGLRRIRLRRVDGLQRVERCYDFEVSISGNDREPGRLWMIGGAMTSLSLPVTERVASTESGGREQLAVHNNITTFPPRPPRPPLPTDRAQ